MLIFLMFVGIITLSVLIGCLISAKENNKETTEIKYYFSQELIDADIPYNGPDFINRFETDAWDLRY